jgi:vacuolar-type H+-ATPase subunit I/STV1
LQFATSRFSTFSLMVEHDAWDVNAGAQIEVRGLRASVYMMEIGAGSAKPGSLAYQKLAVSIGWQTNLSALLRGNRMEQMTEEYRSTSEGLRAQIAAGGSRVRTLEAQLKTLQTAQEADAIAQRADLERRLREEQDAVRRLQELLKQREAQKKP